MSSLLLVVWSLTLLDRPLEALDRYGLIVLSIATLVLVARGTSEPN